MAIVPEARALSVGNLKRSTEISVSITDSDLVLAPAEFNFDPTSNVVAYLKSLVKSVAILEMIPHFLTIITQRIVAELYQMTAEQLGLASKELRRGFDAGDNPAFVPVLRGNMSKIEANEFDAFVPLLRRLCDRVFGRYLTVANTVHLIGKAAEEILQESGQGVDVGLFYTNCLGAVHVEVKNFITAFLHGSKSSARVFANSTVAITEALKGRSSSNAKKQTRAVMRHQINPLNPYLASLSVCQFDGRKGAE